MTKLKMSAKRKNPETLLALRSNSSNETSKSIAGIRVCVCVCVCVERVQLLVSGEGQISRDFLLDSNLFKSFKSGDKIPTVANE